MNFLNYVYGGGAVVGKQVGTGKRVRLKEARRSTYVVGIQGTGKSTLLLNLILSDIERNDKGVVVLDPHGDLARDILQRCPPAHADRVVYFAPAEQTERVLGLNPFEVRSPREYHLKFEAVMDVFGHSWHGGHWQRMPTLQNTLETLIRTLFAAYPTYQTNFWHMLLLIEQSERGQTWRRRLGAFVKEHPPVAMKLAEWSQRPGRLKSDTESSRNKINHMLNNPTIRNILGQSQSAGCFRFQEMPASNGVLLVNLHPLDEESQRLVGSLLLTQLFTMARLRADEAERVPCHVYADEFYIFSPQSFVDIIDQGRKYRLFCTLAHQNLSQLSQRAAGAAGGCGNVIVFRVNPEDAGSLNRHFYVDEKRVPPLTLASLPDYVALVKYKDRRINRQARVETLKPRGRRDAAVAAHIRHRSEAYGRPVAEIQQTMRAILELDDGDDTPPGRRRTRVRERTPASEHPAGAQG